MKTFDEWREDYVKEGLRDHLDIIEMQIFLAGAEEMYSYIFKEVLKEVPNIEPATGEYLDRWAGLIDTRDYYTEGEHF